MDVVIGAVEGDAFAAACLGRRSTAEERARLLALMEAQRWRLGMFASCGWFWEDPIRTETHQVLRAAARAARLVDGLAGSGLEQRLLADLRGAVVALDRRSTARRSTARRSSRSGSRRPARS